MAQTCSRISIVWRRSRRSTRTCATAKLEYLRNLQAELHHLIDQTQLKLDAIRFIVVTHN
jgi:hypothetical protein